MAESVREETVRNTLTSSEPAGRLECAVCLQTCVHPAELPCGHIFCYLCIKGIVNQGRRCAMCRQDIPVDYLEKPRLVKPFDTEISTPGFEDGHLWFYEGHNGWWQYDERTCIELESAYQKGERCCDLLIAGFLYVADFDGMLQYRKNDPFRRRRIKRDHVTTSKKGIAGIKTSKNCSMPSSNPLEVAANNAVESLPVSNPSILNSLSNLRIFNSGSNSSSQHTETTRNHQRPRGSSNSYSLSSCEPATSSIPVSETDSSPSYIRNSNLDSALHDTLDWTIEQIESLNLELLNDYEALYRDVNNYERLQDNLNQSRFRRTQNNYMSRYLNVTNPLSQPEGNDLDLTDTVSDFSQTSNNDLNNLTLGSPVSLEETDSVYSEVTETFFDRSSLEFDAERPQPPPRSRGLSRSRTRADSLRRSSSLNCETLLQKFISNK